MSVQNVLPPVAIVDEMEFQDVPNNAQVFEDILDVEDAPDVEEVLDAPVEDFIDNPVEDVPIENILEVAAPAGPVAPRRSTRTRRPPDRLMVDFRAPKIYKSAR